MNERNKTEEIDTVRSAHTMFDVIGCLKEGKGMTVSEVATSLDYAKSTVHRHLRTLEVLGYVVQRDDGYRIGLRFLDLGQRARNHQPGYELARDKVEEIAAETDERAQFLVEEHGEAVYICRSIGDHAVQTDPGIGRRIPLHSTAAGKAILSGMSEERLSEVIERSELEPVTGATITEMERLLDELDGIRERGYSFNQEENIEGLNAVGVPVCVNGEVIGALSVSGPSHRLKGNWFKQELPDLLLGAANELQLNITYL